MSTYESIALSETSRFQKLHANLLTELEQFSDDTSTLLYILDSNSTETSNSITCCLEVHFSATQNTLQSIVQCCKISSFADARMLIRKYRDDLFQAIFFIEQIKAYEEFSVIGTPIPTELNNDIEIIMHWHNYKKLEELEKIDKAKYEKICNTRKRILDATHYKNTLLHLPIVNELCSRFFNETWEYINIQANDYTHSNTLKSLKDNVLDLHDYDDSQNNLNNVIEQLQLVTIYAISILFLTNSHQFRSSDYIDYLDMGETPPEGSQHWIPPVIQDFFDKYLSLVDPQLKDYLKDENIYCMQVD